MDLGLLSWSHMSGGDTCQPPSGSLCREGLSAKMALGLFAWSHMSGADTCQPPTGWLCREWLSAKLALGLFSWSHMSGDDTCKPPTGSLCQETLSAKFANVATSVPDCYPLAALFCRDMLFSSRQRLCRVPVFWLSANSCLPKRCTPGGFCRG